MSNPYTDLFPVQADTTPATQEPEQESNPFSDLFPSVGGDKVAPGGLTSLITGQPTEPEPPSPWRSMWTKAKNFSEWYGMPYYARAQMEQAAGYDGPGTLEILKQKGSAFVNNVGGMATAFGANPNQAAFDALKGTAGIVKNQLSEMKRDPVGAVGGLISGIIVDPVVDASTAITGVKFDDPSGLRAANPIERAQAIQMTVANGVALAVGMGTHRGLAGVTNRSQRAIIKGEIGPAALVKREKIPVGQAGAVTTRQLVSLGETSKEFLVKNELVRNAIVNLPTGYASGLAYGMISGADSPDMASEMLASGIMFAGFGTVATLFQGGVGMLRDTNVPLQSARVATELANIRQYKQHMDMLPDVMQRVEILANSPSVSVAVAKHHKANEISRVRGVTYEELELVRDAMTGPAEVKTNPPLTLEENLELEGIRQKLTEVSDVASTTPPGEITFETLTGVEQLQAREKELLLKQQTAGLTVTQWPHEKGTIVAHDTRKPYQTVLPSEPGTTHAVGGSLQDVLLIGNEVAEKLTSEQLSSFRKYGYVQDQLVSYQGENYRLTALPFEGMANVEIPNTVKITRLDKPQTIDVHISEISDVPLGDTYSLGVENMKLNYSIKAQVLSEMYPRGHKAGTQPSVSKTAGDIWRRNKEILLAAKSGKPMRMIAFRSERGTPIAGTGHFYSADLNGAMAFPPASGAKAGPAKQNTTLRIHELNFSKPYVVDGGHRTLVEELTRKWFADNMPSFDPNSILRLDDFGERAPIPPELPKEYRQLIEASEVTERAPGESGFQLQDKIIRKILTEQGYDGLVYNKTRGGKNVTWNDINEIVDFQGVARRDVVPEIQTISFPEPRIKAITDRLYNDFREVILGNKEEVGPRKLSVGDEARLAALEAKQNTPTGKDPNTGRDIYDVLSDAEARELIKLRSMKNPLPPRVERTAYTEMDRVKDKIRELEREQAESKLVNVDRELEFYRDYAGELQSGKTPNFVIREPSKKSLAEMEGLGNGKSFKQSVIDFATEQGMDSEIAALEQQFAQRMFKELMKDLDTEDAVVLDKLLTEHKNEVQAKAKDQKVTLAKTIDTATRAGLYLERAEAGEIIIRDVNTNKRVAQFSKLEDAKDFIVKSGTEKGIEFDGGGDNGPIPPWVFGGDMATPVNPVPPNKVPYDPSTITKMEKAIAWITTTRIGKVITGNNKLFIDHDILYDNKTQFYNEVFRTVQDGWDQFTLYMKKVEPRLLEIQARARAIDSERRAKIGEAIETMSPDEVVNLYFKHRQLSQSETNLGNWLADNNVDIREIHDFISARKYATEGMGVTSPEYQREVIRVKREAGLHENPVLAEAIDRVDLLKGDPGASYRLARSRMARDGKGELTRAEFMKENNFTKYEKDLMRDIESAFDLLTNNFNIPDYQRLNNFMAHIKLYDEGMFVPSTVRDVSKGFGNIDTDFYAKMARSGEIDIYERDPIIALVRYARAGFKANHLLPAVDVAMKSAEAQLKKLPNDGRKVRVQDSLKRFFDDVRGATPPLDREINAMLDAVLNEKFGLRVDAKRVANAISLVGEAAAQGLKPLAGTRDFITNVAIMWSEFGVDKTRKFIQYGLIGAEHGGKRETRRSLREAGVVPDRSALILENPVERGTAFDPSPYVRAANKVVDVGMEVSLQPAAYRFAHTGVYLTFITDSDAALSRLNKKQITKAQAYKEVGVDKFEAPIRQRYDELVTDGKFNDASVYIAKVAQEQIIGKFGQANGLHYSGNIAGRIFGQFGTWASFTARNIGRQISTGTNGARAAKIIRASAVSYALASVSEKTGVDLGNWYIFPGASFFDDNAALVPVAPPGTGGPAIESYRTVWDALTARGMRQKEAWRKVKQVFPVDDKTGNLSGPHLYYPFSYQIDAMMNAYDSFRRGKFGQAAYEAVGGRVSKPQGGYGGF